MDTINEQNNVVDDSIESLSNVEIESTNDFTNNQVSSINLPKIEDISYEPIQKTSMYVGYIVIGITAIIAVIILVFILMFSEVVRAYMWYALAAIIAFISILFLTETKAFKNTGFAVREHDILHKYGWLWRTVVVIPYNRIQHIEVNQGPIDRLFDLSSLSLYTAGGSVEEIEGLLPDQAQNIKAFIIAKNSEIKSSKGDDEEE